mmetsp:Transcript_3884/g.17145  ORF Transcript_3884/g.17145 Transcript_3884/m.17145 type:complete len:214 (+) Transcript_3884:4090-4731(+)
MNRRVDASLAVLTMTASCNDKLTRTRYETNLSKAVRRNQPRERVSLLRNLRPSRLRLRIPLEHPPHHLRRRSLRDRDRHRPEKRHGEGQTERNPEARQRHRVTPHHPLLRLEVEPRLVKVRIQQLPRQRVRGDGGGERARDERSGDGHEGDADADRDGDARESREGLRPGRRDAQGPQAEAVGGLELRDAGGAQRREGRRGGGRGGDGPRTGR